MSISFLNFSLKLAPLGLLLIALPACSPEQPSGTGTSAESAAPSMTAAEAASLMATEGAASSVPDMAQASPYVGQWKGPEGTLLTITPASGGDDAHRFDVAIRDLDRTRHFSGTLEDDGVHIERDGKNLIIHQGNGQETGMKWLADKQNCLVVDANEGYCRD